MKSQQSRTITIIGGGVIGAACAYQLAKENHKITIIDQQAFGEGSSYGNCGLILPSHILPLNMPGTFFKAIKWTLSKDAPLYLKPTLKPEIWLWFLKFIKRCNQKDMMAAAKGRFALLKDAVRLFDEFITEEKIQCDWQKKGVLYIFESDKELDAYSQIDKLIRLFLDDGIRLNKSDTLKMEKSLSDTIAGAWFYKNGAHLRPDALMAEYKRLLQKMGVTIIENENIVKFNTVDSRLVSVESNNNKYSSEQFVIATGAWTNKISKQLRIPTFIQPGKGYSLTTNNKQNQVNIPCLLEDVRVVVTPWQSGMRLGGTMEFSGFDDTLNHKRLSSIQNGAKGFFNKALTLSDTENWCGWRPMTYTGLPVIDFVPNMKNTILTAGHNMLGLSMAISTANIVASMLDNRELIEDLNPYQLR